MCLLSAASGHRLSKPKSKALTQKKSDVTPVPEEKECTTAQTEEDLDPNAMFAFS